MPALLRTTGAAILGITNEISRMRTMPVETTIETTDDIAALRAVMTRLRDPEAGCPWDTAQTFRTIAPYTIEEAYEVADAIDRDDLPADRKSVV